ncbi:MAG: HAD family hydrolase [Candidatus Cloacimonas sp. SDB]|nr:MAG: HAD family hydrolase [Candidatus Cloacimonas sp. SDB]
MKKMNQNKVIAFDADDTLWINETFYKEAENKFSKLLKEYLTEKESFQELFNTEMQNIGLFGYGAKGFTLSMIETALKVSERKISTTAIQEILNIGKKLMDYPLVVLPGVEQVLAELREKCRIIIITKGDLIDQERKLDKSGLTPYFHHIEILSNKKEENYRNLLTSMEIDAENFLMIGNSLRSDIIPVLNIGAYAIHIPFRVNWVHESEIEEEINSNKFFTTENITQITEIAENNFLT